MADARRDSREAFTAQEEESYNALRLGECEEDTYEAVGDEEYEEMMEEACDHFDSLDDWEEEEEYRSYFEDYVDYDRDFYDEY